MAVFSLIIFVQIVVCCSGNINIMCKDGDDEHSVKCRFMETGSYTLINLNEAVKHVEFDRLTDSSVLLPGHVKELTIKSTSFDTFAPCDHVKSRSHVLVKEEDKGTTSRCVSIIVVCFASARDKYKLVDRSVCLHNTYFVS